MRWVTSQHSGTDLMPVRVEGDGLGQANPSLLLGLTLPLLRCIAMNQVQADKAIVNFTAAWCINALIINRYKSFL